jgi:LruC domain-containing protein
LNINLVAGQALGFFVIPNGWGWGGSNGSINSLGPWNQPFYTLPTLNPEAAALQAHNVAFYDALNRFFVFGFDDQNRNQGDNDFNDLLVSVVATPSYAVEGINPDGSVDANTYQVLVQSNAEVTSTTYYPSQNDTATLVFEDLWPRMGDYDFNDLVLSYRFTNTLNNRNRLTAMEWNFSLQALGASYHNGLALHLPNVAADNIKSSTLSRNGVVIRTDLLESGHSDAHFVLFDDLKTLVESTCEFFRTLTNCESAVNDTYTLSIVFTNPVDTAAIGQPPYDPYLFATEGGMHGSYSGRGWEVHMKQFSGSALFSTSFYGDLDDRSDGQNHFLNRNNFPWVINIPGTWDHPLEGVDTLRAYPQLKDWVESKGSAHQDWYLKANAVRSNLYGQ